MCRFHPGEPCTAQNCPLTSTSGSTSSDSGRPRTIVSLPSMNNRSASAKQATSSTTAPAQVARAQGPALHTHPTRPWGSSGACPVHTLPHSHGAQTRVSVPW